MKILFCWTGVTSYMADCWRALQAQPGVELKVIVETAASGREFAAEETLKGLDFELVEKDNASACEIAVFASTFIPDVVFAGGWRSVTTRRVIERYQGAARVFCLDMPWRWSVRCIAARWALRGFLRKFDAVYVPGASAAKYARWLGFSEDSVYRKLYAIDAKRIRDGVVAANAGGATGFLFVGRHEQEKRVDLIERAYARYRELGGRWTLDCYGQGGKFVQAADMPKVYAKHACLLLASEFDPWPLVMLEAKTAGLEVIASDRCGNADELNAIKVPFGDVEAMARRMLEVEKSFGGGVRRGAVDAVSADYDVNAWAVRTVGIARTVAANRHEPNGMQVVDGLLRRRGMIAADEIWVHGMWTADKWIRCIVAKASGKKLVRMIHGGLSPVYLERQGKWKKRLVGPIEKLLLAWSDRVVATGEWEKAWILAYAPKAKVEIVDLKQFFDLKGMRSMRKARTQDGTTRVLYLGRRHPLKGVEYLERAVSVLNGEGTSRAFELRIVSDHYGEELEDDWKWCDVLVLPTLSENFGLVVAEALERGVPVITTDGAPAWRGQDGVEYVEGFVNADDEWRVKAIARSLSSKRCSF